MSIPVRNFLKARRDRALGAILGYAEREIFPKLSPTEQTAFRKVVLESLNSYHDSALDLFKADTGTVRNDELFELLSRIEDKLDNSPNNVSIQVRNTVPAAALADEQDWVETK